MNRTRLYRIRFIAALTVFCLAAMMFLGSVWATFWPTEFERRVEWAQYKWVELVPQPSHPEFVPTPEMQTQGDTETWGHGEVSSTLSLSPTPLVSLSDSPTATAVPAVPTRTPTRPQPPSTAFPPRVALTGFRHDYQRFNNCGPATLAILLSHFGRTETQYDLAPILKGNKDDRNVSPDEIAALVQTYGLHVSVRVNGSENEMKALLAQGIPVMIENWFVPQPKNASGHYRLLTGYDDTGKASTHGVGLSAEFGGNDPGSETGYFIAQDSYTGPNIKLPYHTWDEDWKVFNRTYLVVYADPQAATVRSIIGDNADNATMYTRARDVARREVAANEKDAYAWFDLGSSLVGLGKYADAAGAFDRARVLKLPFRMLWYQFGPYEAYYRSGHYQEVISLANATLATSAGLEESLYYRGLAQWALEQKDAARASFQLALQANAHFAPAQQALDSMANNATPP